MFISNILMFCGGLLVSAAIAADGTAIHFSVAQDSHRQFELAVSQMPLKEALEAIAKTTGVTLHYSGLPEQPITVTCLGASIKEIFECLLDNNAGLIFRYGQKTAAAQNNTLVEAWILADSSNGGEEVAGKGAITPAPVHKMAENPFMEMLDKIDINTLIATTHASDAEQRANAIAALAVQSQADNPTIRKALATALSDQAAEVRAQAVFGLAKYMDAEASAGLEAALQDSDAAVRLMVVDNADNHPALLQQALADSDEAVRAYAATKLEALAIQ